jgi:hypothetical protein
MHKTASDSPKRAVVCLTKLINSGVLFASGYIPKLASSAYIHYQMEHAENVQW